MAKLHRMSIIEEYILQLHELAGDRKISMLARESGLDRCTLSAFFNGHSNRYAPFLRGLIELEKKGILVLPENLIQLR